MKIIYLSLVGLSLSFISYSQVYTPKKENGWYQIIDGQHDSISCEPIVVATDFVELSLVYDSFDKSVIAGRVSAAKQSKWADATEKSIGKRIGFVFNDTVITDPQVNARIESGYFQISNSYGYDLKRIYRLLLIDSCTGSTSVSINQPDSKLLWKEAHQYRATITDSTFLSTKGIMSDKAIDPLVSGGWNKNYAYNQVVYLEALERAKRHLSVKDNKFVYPLKSGKEINISEDIHQYIYYLFEKWNRWVADGRYKIAKNRNGFYDIIPYKQQ